MFLGGKGCFWERDQHMRKHKGSQHIHKRTVSYVLDKRCRGKLYQARGPAGQARTALCVCIAHVAWRVHASMEITLFKNSLLLEKSKQDKMTNKENFTTERGFCKMSRGLCQSSWMPLGVSHFCEYLHHFFHGTCVCT